jgi:hypothetical protein
MTNVKMNNGLLIKIPHHLNVLSREDSGTLGLDFNFKMVHVFKNLPFGDEEDFKIKSFSEPKVEDFLGEQILRGYDYDKREEAILPIKQIKKMIMSTTQEVSCYV